jgi:hypothetical protein
MSAPDPPRAEAESPGSPSARDWPVPETDPKPPDAVLPCLFCRQSIPADSFAYQSSLRRLVVTQCPHCRRRVTLPTRLWLDWGQQ